MQQIKLKEQWKRTGSLSGVRSNLVSTSKRSSSSPTAHLLALLPSQKPASNSSNFKELSTSNYKGPEREFEIYPQYLHLSLMYPWQTHILIVTSTEWWISRLWVLCVSSSRYEIEPLLRDILSSPQMLRINLNATLIRRTSGARPVKLQTKECSFRYWEVVSKQIF